MIWPAKERTLAMVRRRRAALVEALGGCCRSCGTTDRLQFHHTEPRTWVARELSRWQRIKRYEDDALRGVVRLLCRSCNATAGAPTGELVDCHHCGFPFEGEACPCQLTDSPGLPLLAAAS